MIGYDVIVVGGGVIGCAVAFALARAGVSVLVVERDRVGAHASGASAGMLAPLTESPGEGLAQAIGLEAFELFPSLVEEIRELSGIDPGFRRSGILRLAEADEVVRLREQAARLEGQGCEWLGAEELHKLDVRFAPELAGAVWSPHEGYVDGFLLTRAYAAAAARRGARFQPGTTVTGLRLRGSRVEGVRSSAGAFAAREVVLCTGAWTRLVEDWLDVSLPVEPVKGQMVALESPDPEPRFVFWGRGAYAVPRSGVLRVGATVEREGFDVRPTAAGIGSLLNGVTRLMPCVSECGLKRAWAGLRPGTPDDLPLLGPVAGVFGLTVAAGHYRTGILLSGYTGLAVADWILTGKLPELARGLDPGRFQRVHGA